MQLAETCHRCSLAKTRITAPVWGDGPVDVAVMLVGQNPGKVEDRTGMPFNDAAPAGQEMNWLLAQIGLPRRNIYVTNLCKCMSNGDRAPTAAEIEACSYWLEQELDRVRPRYVVTLGRPATQYFLGDVDMEQAHGLPYQVNGKLIIPCYHPAAGLHRPELMMRVQSDFHAVKAIISGQIPPVHIKDEYPEPDYRVVSGPAEVYDDGVIALVNNLITIDTEECESGTWSVQYAARPGAARFIHAADIQSLKALGEVLAEAEIITGISNCLYDLPVLDRLHVYPAKIADTMVMAYLLQSESQGLKPQAYRHCGMQMREYTEVVADAGYQKAVNYLLVASTIAWPDPDQVLQFLPDKLHIKQPQNIGKKILRILHDAESKGADPRERWINIEYAEGRGMVEAELGPMPVGYLSDIPFEDAMHYACKDPDATLRVYPHLWARIVSDGLEDTFWRDMRCIPMISDMMLAGIRIEPEHFRNLSAYLQAQMDIVQADIAAKLLTRGILQPHFNPGSPPQVRKVLFEREGMNLEQHKEIKRQRLSRSTDNATLSRLIDMRSIVGDTTADIVKGVQEWRSYQKLKGTYADVMPGYADADSRVHTTFRITRTSTGRPASAAPNLLNQPVRSSEGRKLRDGFVAQPGCVLLSCDLSQIEMRIAAHCSQDPEMLRVFREGLDIHSQTASKIFGVPMEQLDEMKHRYPAKRVGFGVLYAIGAAGLQGTIIQVEGVSAADWPVDRCDELIRSWFDVYKGVRSYMDAVITHALRYGWVADLFGRRRNIPHAKSKNEYLRAEALRQAQNAPIQSGATGVQKEAMGQLVPVYRDYRAKGVTWNPLLTIYDDLVSEVHEQYLPEVADIVQYTMCNAVKLSIPVLADCKVGVKWGSMSKYPPKEQ